MKSSPYDLRQLYEDAVRRLPGVALRHLPLTLLADLMDPLERLAENLRNITRTPRSQASWDCYPPVKEPVFAVAAHLDGLSAGASLSIVPPQEVGICGVGVRVRD